MTPQVNCKFCGDTGQVIQDSILYWCDCAAADKQQREYRTRIIATSKLPDTYGQSYLDDITPHNWQKPPYVALKTLAYTGALSVNKDTAYSGVWLVGVRGCGKSMLLTAAGYTLADRLYPVLYVAENQLKNELWQLTRDDPLLEQALINKLATYPVVILDELGILAPTQFLWERYHTIFDSRWSKGLITLIASNFTPQEIEHPDRAGKHATLVGTVISRIRGTCALFNLDNTKQAVDLRD